MNYMGKNIYLDNKKLNQYLVTYVGKSGANLDKAVTALFELVDDGILEEDTAKKVLKLLLTRHMQNEIVGEIKADACKFLC